MSTSTSTSTRSMLRRIAAPLALVAVLTGCAGGSSEEPTAPATVTTQAAPSDEDQATAAYQRYWDVWVQLSTSGDIDARAFDGVAEGAFVESDLKALRDQADAGIVRVGEPEFSAYETTVDGTTATSVVCLDERAWGARSGDRTLDPPGEDFPPRALRATLTAKDDGWIVTDVTSEDQTPCPVG